MNNELRRFASCGVFFCAGSFFRMNIEFKLNERLQARTAARPLRAMWTNQSDQFIIQRT